MRFLLYSDLHTREKRLLDCSYVLKQIGKLAKKYKVDYVYNGGDTFHTRGLIRTSCFDMLYRHFRDWAKAGIKQIINIGNHDQEDKTGLIHPMKVFEQFKDWYVIDKPTKLPLKANIAFFPYMNEVTEKDIKKILAIPGDGPCDAFVHWGIKGANMNKTVVDTDGIPMNWLKKFRMVISGHYHLRQMIGNVFYIGTPMQQDFNEMGQDKGVGIYNTDTGEFDFHEIDGTPKHYEVEVWWEGDKRKMTKIETKPQDIIRVHVKGDAERVSGVSRESLTKSLNCESLHIHRDMTEKAYSRINMEKSEIYDTTKIMDKYVDFVSTDLDVKKLKQLGSDIVNGNGKEK